MLDRLWTNRGNQNRVKGPGCPRDPKLAVISLVILAMGVLFALAPSVIAGSETDDIAGQLACQCGCGYTALACGGAMQCDIGDQMVALISQKVKNGETREEIIAYFVGQYGEKVLASPTKEGFNLTAWIMPFFAVAVGGAVVYFVLRNWLDNHRLQVEAEPAAPADLGSYGERIDRELEQYG
ncbi:MAG: cytochrome c-type biogenesis protein CcmH [Dehalococcoidia bacterium]|nr:cytochrome c-type biogenesis protein CcmH [Dehalococcoidia bacterium]